MTHPKDGAGGPVAPEPRCESPEERPPLGSWKRMYALVLGNLALLILLFYWFTKAFE